jgi:hypothetical protein
MMKHTKGKSAVTPSCAFCAGIGKPYTPHWQFSKPIDGVLTCPILLAYTCRICNGKGHIEKRCTKQIVQKQRELFCRFCCNAKKPDYQSHNQYDNDGFVQCPVLLAIECQLCCAKGHTKSYCTSVVMPPASSQPATKVSKKTDKKNQFSALAAIEEENIPVQKSQPNSWAGRVTKPAPVPVVVQSPVPVVVQVPVPVVVQVPVPVVVQVPAPVVVQVPPVPVVVQSPVNEEEISSYVYVPKNHTSWADME